MRIRRLLVLAFAFGISVLPVLASPAAAKPDGYGTCKLVLDGSTGPNGLPRVIECYY